MNNDEKTINNMKNILEPDPMLPFIFINVINLIHNLHISMNKDGTDSELLKANKKSSEFLTQYLGSIINHLNTVIEECGIALFKIRRNSSEPFPIQRVKRDLEKLSKELTTLAESFFTQYK